MASHQLQCSVDGQYTAYQYKLHHIVQRIGQRLRCDDHTRHVLTPHTMFSETSKPRIVVVLRRNQYRDASGSYPHVRQDGAPKLFPREMMSLPTSRWWKRRNEHIGEGEKTTIEIRIEPKYISAKTQLQCCTRLDDPPKRSFRRHDLCVLTRRGSATIAALFDVLTPHTKFSETSKPRMVVVLGRNQYLDASGSYI